MTTRLGILTALVLATSTCAAPQAQAAPVTESIASKGGPIRITPIFHGSLQIEYRGKVIHVDPFSEGDYSRAKKSDAILITHTHGDHLDKKALARLIKPSSNPSVIYAPLSAARELDPSLRKNTSGFFRTPGATADVFPISSAEGELVTIGFPREAHRPRFLMTIEAVPMYNIVRGPKPGQKFHPKGQFNGYVLTLGGKRIYIAGDTEATPEMKALKNIDVAFLPMNLPYTMTPLEAAQGARAFRPKIVYPYHYRSPFTRKNNHPQQFAAALKGSGVQVRVRDWYSQAKKN